MSRAPAYVSPPPPDSEALRASTKRYKAHNDKLAAAYAAPVCTCGKFRSVACAVHR